MDPRPSPRTACALLAVVVTLVLALAACSDADDDGVATSEPSTTGAVTSTSETATTLAPTTEAPATTAPTTEAPATTAGRTTTTPPTTEALPPFPPEAGELVHGGTIWVVVLAGSDTASDPALEEATNAADEAGYVTGPTDCDEGAAEAIGLAPGAYTVSAYFDTEEDAVAAQQAFAARGVSGEVAQVRTYCLD
jgi:uncharacterized cupredoxin-like copper-binding protein